ncbi:hypothetical protein COU60_02285 [Candidatus Pacearchaeota archaeon CG10_big_fil_rev_8_21_14_0_10_34_76]|nr:MAG: hypothetical protein COU60_02285 [Candidatus Pacearchaeota archaeon CG10_big_fil_rev_8_21_14_0_10_34_76]
MEPGKKPEQKGLGGQLNSPDKYVPQSQMPGQNTEAIQQAEKTKKELEDLKKKILKKFPFTMVLGVLPANSFKIFEDDEGLLPEEIEKKPLHMMMIIPEDHFKDVAKKIKPEVVKLVQESKQNIWVHIKTPVDVWNYGLDSKYEFLDAIGSSFPLHDTGFLGQLRLATIHKSLVLRKFEKYVASYVIGGSLVTGTAGKDSDVDTFVIIDDTDVKRMPRLQLLEKLRGIIYDYIREANALAGISNPLNVQVYLLTDFWDNVKDANPVMFTFIRDGVPMYDRGTFLPWKLLLQMGKIKPSPEAVDKFMKYGEQNEGLVTRRMLDAFVDIYWGIVTPTQALMMLAGQAPPTPKVIAQEVKKLFVEKEKIMGIKEWNFLDKMMKMWKDYEHGKIKSIPGKEIDEILKEANEYDKKLKEIRKKLEGRIVLQGVEQTYNDVFDLLKALIGNRSKEQLVKDFEKELVKTGRISKRFIGVLRDIMAIRQKAKTGKITQGESDKVRREASELVKALTEYSQRKELAVIDKNMLEIRYGERKAEIILTGSGAFFVEEGRVIKIGKTKFEDSNAKELEKAISMSDQEMKASIESHVFDVLKKELGGFEIEF